MGSREDRDGIYPAADYLGNWWDDGLLLDRTQREKKLQEKERSQYSAAQCSVVQCSVVQCSAVQVVPAGVPTYHPVIFWRANYLGAAAVLLSMHLPRWPVPSITPASCTEEVAASSRTSKATRRRVLFVADADDANAEAEADTSQKPTVPSRCLLGSALSSRPNSGV
ncbi:hypothetical protein M0804_001810 [Polistes exclamans]|nr:hypothetical protein M0804_001810 [Polistes exclamans]